MDKTQLARTPCHPSSSETNDEPQTADIDCIVEVQQPLADNVRILPLRAEEEISTLFRLTKQIRNSPDLETILQVTVNEVQNLLKSDCCFFLWCLNGGDRSALMVTHEALADPSYSQLGDIYSEYLNELIDVINCQRIVHIEDVSHHSQADVLLRSLFANMGISAALMLPIETHSGQSGALVCAQCHSTRVWSDFEIELLQAIADQVAISIDQSESLARARAAAIAAQSQAQQVSETLQRLQQTQAQLVQQEKMSSLGQLVAGVAHEINNPVNFIDGNIEPAANYIHGLIELLKLYRHCYPNAEEQIQVLEEELDITFVIEDLPKILTSMKLGTSRIKEIVRSLKNFSRLDEAEVKPVDLHEGLDNTLIILKSRLKANKHSEEVKIVRQFGILPLVECHAGQINQVFMNILSNAIDAVEGQPEPTITIQTQLIEDPSHLPLGMGAAPQPPFVDIRIRDNGQGMEEAIRQKVFDPFYTTKAVGKGTGLGLSISYQIVVEKHQGVLQCFSTVGKGTEFGIQIPVTVAHNS